MIHPMSFRLVRRAINRVNRFHLLFAFSLLYTFLPQIVSYDVFQPYLNDGQITTLRSDISDSSNSTEIKSPIDWREVEDNFNKVLSEEEVFQKWNTMEANMKSGIRALLRTIFPKVVALSADAKVSGNCSAGILKWIVNLRHMKTWALRMLDAIGKPPSGIFEGVTSMFGNYDQCLKIRVFHDDEEASDVMYNPIVDETKEFFRGQYCVAEFKPWLPKKPNFYGMNTVLKSPFQEEDSVFSEFARMAVFFHFISFRVDLCVPSTCTRDDIQRVANLMANLAEFRARVLRCEVDNGQAKWNAYFTAISLVIISLIVLGIVATLHELQVFKCVGVYSKFLTAFSMRNSWRTLNRLSNSHCGCLNSLYGIRVIILVWIVIVHTFIVVDFQYFREMQMLKSWASNWTSQVLTNSLFQFDCLILITAFAFGYVNIGNSGMHVLKYWFRQYVKISVLIIAMMCATLSLPFIMTRGPLTQDFIGKQIQVCQTDGWWNLFFLQNFFETKCMPYTWIFCVEFQLMLLVTPFLIVYRKGKENKLARNVFWFGLPILLMIGLVYNFTQVYMNRLPPIYYWTLPDQQQRSQYFDYYFHKPWTHLSVFAIGFYTGVYRKLTNSAQKSVIVDQNIIGLGHFLSLLTITTFTFGFHDWVVGELPNELISAIYNACQNVCLALAYSWIMFTLTDSSKQNCDQRLTRLLGGKKFRTLGKLTVSGYLSLPFVQTILLSSQQQHLYSSTLLMVYVMLGNLIFTYLFALIISLLIEVPALQILTPILDYLFKRNEVNGEETSKCKNSQIEIEPPPCEGNIELAMSKERL